MHLKNGTLEGIRADILNASNRIVVFGSGVIGATVVPELLQDLGLDERVVSYIDNDQWKWDSFVTTGDKRIPIASPGKLTEYDSHTTILIAVSRYAEVLEQLRGMACVEDMDVCLVPMLCITNFSDVTDDLRGLIKSAKPMIPKKIHYMWLGGSELPERLQVCIDSWRRHCPDYEIIRWDESNYDVHKNVFMSEAYDHRWFGFVPDYARLDLLYRYGGIYMDTDVEVVRNLDSLLNQEAFCGVEKWQVLNFGACSGAVKGHKALEPFLERWESRHLVREDGTLDSVSSGLIDTSVALENGYRVTGKCQNVCGMNIYASDYFSPFDYMTGELCQTEHTYSIHHFHGGWLDAQARKNCEESRKQYRELADQVKWVG